jgi:hypothetical protein
MDGGTQSQPAGWILVIQPRERALFELLRKRLADTPVTVLLDRRQRERRRGSMGHGVDRRTVERRRRRSVAWLVPAEAPEIRVPVTPPEARPDRARNADALTRPCPTCTAEVELDLPRFPQPPARLELTVSHVAANGRGPEHYVEIAAFTVTGRLLLSQRAPGRRRS